MNIIRTTCLGLIVVGSIALGCKGSSATAGGAGANTGTAGSPGSGGMPATGGGTTGGQGGTGAVGATAFIVDHRSANAFDQIPQSFIDKAQSELRFFYGHLSHGEQVVNGLDILADVNSSTHSYTDKFLKRFSSSLDPRPQFPAWEPATRTELNASGNDRNVVMWAWSSWLGSPDEVNEAFVSNEYLAKMEQLEIDFPNVRFIYFTGPAQTWLDSDRNMTKRNAQIRDYAKSKGKILFDFEDIELHAPDGTYHANGTHSCEWCGPWCSANDCSPVVPPNCSVCGDRCNVCSSHNHTHCFICYRKAQAFWWLAARLAGWSG